MEILGYPTFVLMREARSPAVSAPKKAAAAGGKPARSTSSRRKVLDSAPMKAAAAARRHATCVMCLIKWKTEASKKAS